MRFAFLTLLTLNILPTLAYANEGGGLVLNVGAPWTEEQEIDSPQSDIVPKKISLADLEDLDTFAKGTAQVKDASSLELLYSSRIIDQLEQYGYDLFSDTKLANATQINDNQIPAGTVQDNYILSAGDTLNVILRGQMNTRRDYMVDNQGLLIIDDLPPITAAGRSLKNVKDNLQKEIQNLHNTQIFVSLSGVRQIGVLVVGNVNNPGRQNLTSFHTALDALTQAGGINKNGTLRNVKLVRKGKSHFIDLYQLLMSSGGGADKLLQDGDRIIVPPIGPTMAVSGAVKRPAIYEIRQSEKISLHQALGLAGGTITPGQNRYMKLEYTTGGEETVQDVAAPELKQFGDGTILMVAQSEQKRASAVTLEGHTRQPGTHDLKKSKTLSGLITDDKVLGNDIYPLIGVIERRDPIQLTKKLVAFSPHQVLNKNHDEKLSEGDGVRLFSMEQIRGLEPQNNPLLHQASITSAADENTINDPVLTAFLKERAVFVRGAVRQEGAYPIGDSATLDSILAVAGGIALEGNSENIELTSRTAGRMIINTVTQDPKVIAVEAGDTVRVNQKFKKIMDNSVMVMGEVNHPGRYDLMPGDTLSKLVERAGGLTAQSYPDGAIFSRARERKSEENRYKSLAQDLELKLAASMQQMDEDKKPDMTQVSATQTLIAQLKNAQALGRITVEADPASLSANPALDVLLETGDKIFIPKRPMTVRVAGEVFSPAALQFREGKNPIDYINEAGGTTYYADKDRAFVVYPDGAAQPLSVSAWNHKTTFIPPGSTIFVPRDPKPFDFLESATRVSQVIANLAISGLYIEAIGDD